KGKKRSNSRPQPLQGLAEQAQQLLESSGKFVGKVQTDHRPLPMRQGIIFAEGHCLVKLSEGVMRPGNSFIGETVCREDYGRTVNQRIAEEISSVFRGMWSENHQDRPLQCIAQHAAKLAKFGVYLRGTRHVYEQTHMFARSGDAKECSERFLKAQ